MRVWFRWTAVTVLAALAASALGAPAQARPAPTPPAPAAAAAVPGGFGSWEELFAMQRGLVAAADAVTAAARGSDGLAGISARPERRELWVYWKGGVPAAVSDAVVRQRARVPVRVLPAAYNEKELLAAAAKVARVPGVTEVGPLPDGSGLSVTTTGDPVALRGSPAVQTTGVRVVVGTGQRPALASRQSSASPHYGGATYTYQVNGQTYMCTAGFAVRIGRATRMLTAGHCGSDGMTTYSGSGAVMGTVSGDNNARDTMLINTLSAGHTYVGAYTSNTSKPVHMALSSYVDTLACSSGAMTGQHCNIRIKAVNQTILVSNGSGGSYSISPVVKAEHDAHGVAVGQGDSGGPMMAQDSQLGIVINYAMGTITALDLAVAVPCGASLYPTSCSWRMWYVDVTKSLDYYGASIVLG